MKLNIISGNEPIEIKQVKNLIYGQPGIGKSSIAFTSRKPLCLDFDRGSHRSDFRKDIVSVNSWTEIAKLNPEDIKDYDTIIIDTLGRCLDFLTAEIIQNDAKMARRDGALTMQGYGALKSRFTQWINQLTLIGKDIIFIAHDKEEKDGDFRIIRPDIIGSSYGEIMKIIDFAGYCYIEGGKRLLNFNPTDKTIGKNSAGFPIIEITDFNKDATFFATIIEQQKSILGKGANKQLEAETAIKKQRTVIDAITDCYGLNAQLKEIVKFYMKGKKVEFEQLNALLNEKAETLDCIFDKQKKAFVEVEVALSEIPDNFDDEIPF